MSEPLRILFLAANPTDNVRLRLEAEYRLLRNRMHDNAEAGNCELRVEFAARPAELQTALLEYKPHVVHFAGHGNGEGIHLETDEGRTCPVSAAQLSTLLTLARRHVRLVVLNACRSAPQTEALGRLVDFVVGTGAPVADDAAVRFTAHFYKSLAVGGTVREAYHSAKKGLQEGGGGVGASDYELITREGADESRPLLPPDSKGDSVAFEAREINLTKGVVSNRIRKGPGANASTQERRPGARGKIEFKGGSVTAEELYIANDYGEEG